MTALPAFHNSSAPLDSKYASYGPTCDPLDVLPGRLKLPADLKGGDYMEFTSLGACSAATATRFNGYGTRNVVPVASWIRSA